MVRYEAIIVALIVGLSLIPIIHESKTFMEDRKWGDNYRYCKQRIPVIEQIDEDTQRQTIYNPCNI